MLTDQQMQDMERLHKDRMDFVFELACKYHMTNEEVMRLCFFSHIEYAHLKQHTLENNHVH